MTAVGRFFFIFEAISARCGRGRASRRFWGVWWCWGGRKRSWEWLGRRRRGAGVSEALEAFRGDRGADRISRGPSGRSTVEDGAGTGTAVCDRGPCTPVDAAVDLDVVWSPGVLPAGR